LSAVGRLSGRFGVERMAQVLVGSSAKEVIHHRLDRVPTYGKLSALTLDQVKDLLGVLADAGLVERQGIEGGRPGAFVLALAPGGRAVARGEARPELDLPLRVPVRTAAEPASSPEADPDVLARLKAWRTEEARRRGMPPYVIFHDRTLEALAAARPRTLDELGRVKGIGPSKLETYGKALLQLLA
ncbi:MAG: HRDC domain-containing protein, partial [Gemmatimonadales bacterium]